MTIDNDIMRMTQEDMVDEIMTLRARLRSTRFHLENRIYEESHNLDFQFIPWSNERMQNFIIQLLDEIEMEDP